MSYCLSERSIDHVLLERGEVANSWRTERWDSLTLLTPNWQSRLPGYGYEGNDPDGYRNVPETVSFLQRYADIVSAPVITGANVSSVTRDDCGYTVQTDQGQWRCRSVVIASGACNIATVPAVAQAIPGAIETVTAMDYRNPHQLPPGGALVVGASATGTQLADEIHRSGRPVTLAVGEHIRAPRVYRGRDIEWWMDVTGIHDEGLDDVDDIRRARRVPSFQLTGTPERRTLDLNELTSIGVKLVGRFAGIQGSHAQFSGSLPNMCKLSDLKMNRLLKTIDEWATENGLDAEVEPSYRLEPTAVADPPRLTLDLLSGEIKSIVWATGYRPDYSWLDVPVLDRKGQVHHNGGVVPDAPGMYIMGLQFLRRRKSALIDGVGDDARDLSGHLSDCLASGALGSS